ncbi:MAG: hypothetical protein JJT88_05475 [Gammaproteobacteria bacterium]|nr:hypothetical protein [Gammaproteobacteria bacterium]
MPRGTKPSSSKPRAAAAAVFTLLLRARRPKRCVRRTVYGLGSGMVTLFATWGLLLALGGRLLC